jgi:hypothetical protein
MRVQLAAPENHFLNPDLYNQIFSMHGTTMMFFFAVPVMLGMGLYFVPLMVGTRNVPFPRLNSVGYWFYLFGGLYLYASFFGNGGPDAGWFSYVPSLLLPVLDGAPRRRLGPDHQLHGGLRADRGGVAHRDRLQAARARNVAQPDSPSSSGRC